METRFFAGIVDGDVFWIFKVDNSYHRSDQVCSAIINNPIIIETTNLINDPKPGWNWDGSNFISPNEESEVFNSTTPILRFVGVLNNKVEFNFTYSINTPNVLRLTAGLRSNPIFIEITNLPTKPDVGWTWNGSEFLEPYIGW